MCVRRCVRGTARPTPAASRRSSHRARSARSRPCSSSIRRCSARGSAAPRSRARSGRGSCETPRSCWPIGASGGWSARSTGRSATRTRWCAGRPRGRSRSLATPAREAREGQATPERPIDVTHAAEPTGWVGRPMLRREDRPLLTGRGRFVDDVAVAGALHLLLARSPHAHARIRSVDTAGAQRTPGVVAVVTAEDLGAIGPVPLMRLAPGTLVPEYPLLAAGVVRAQGVPVAAVVAESTYAAADGVDRLAVEYEPLDGVSDPDGALAPGAPQVVPVSRDNRALTVAWRHGDPDRAFRDAAHRVSLTVQQQRLCGVPMEPRGALARWDPDTGELTVWTSTQAPFRIRSSLARMLGLDEARVRVIAPDVGGGFGVKGGPYREEVLVAWLVDEAARSLEVDPVELRRRNLIPKERFPFKTATGQVYDSGDYVELLDRTLAIADYAGLRRAQAARRARGEVVGVGVATYVEPSGLGWESGQIRVEHTGAVLAVTGSSAHGQGHETTFAQIIADELGVTPEAVTVRHGDTHGAPQGIGTFGSRSTALGGSALVLAARDVREKARALAAGLLEAAPQDVVAVNGGFGVVGA